MASEIGAKAANAMISGMGGGGAGAIKKKVGRVINPKEELLYTGPGDFRTFSLTGKDGAWYEGWKSIH